ncbi:O-antigen ligase family protein [Sporofaciens musculi]|jgi:hypothetical protein|uniref:O-antigen ligase family protein n=2 Tax=Sporofaciens musculi TaxID=2681861 RepID=UPI0025A2B45D|nr:hypothetical protein [Sporofaciens musculi]
MKININAFNANLLAALMISGIALPKQFMGIKGALSVLVIMISLFYLINRKFIDLEFMYWLLLNLIYCLIWTFVGYVKGNAPEGLQSVIRSGILYPVIFALFAISIAELPDMKKLMKAILIGNFICCIIIFITVTDSIGITNLRFLYEALVVGDSVFNKGYMKVASVFTISMTFTAPFSIYYCLNQINKNEKKLQRVLELIIILVASLIAGSRALQVISLAAFIISCMLINKLSVRNVIYIILIVFAFFFVYKYWLKDLGLDIAVVIDRVFYGDNSVRENQTVVLWREFKKHPIIGAGNATFIPELALVNNQMLYESTYLMNLNNTGLIGMVIYISILLYPIITLVRYLKKRRKDEFAVALLIGYCGCLAECHVNPVFTQCH